MSIIILIFNMFAIRTDLLIYIGLGPVDLNIAKIVLNIKARLYDMLSCQNLLEYKIYTL